MRAPSLALSRRILALGALVLCFGFSACKKEEKIPPLSASSLGAGRAAIRFTSSIAFNGSKSFEVNNTAHSTATNTPMPNTSNVRNVKLETTEWSDSAPTRMVLINMAVSYNSTGIDLSLQSGFPLAFIRMESYSLFGITRTSQSGTLTITKFTPTEIEGTFRVEMDDGLKIEDGRFAGRF